MPEHNDPGLAEPVPKQPADIRRWAHTALRRRMLSGTWRGDLVDRLRDQLGETRAAGMGAGETETGGVDLSSNPLATTAGQLACLYDRAPVVGHDDDPASGAIVGELLRRVGWASIMQRVQRDALGLREYLLRVDVYTDTAGEVRLRLRPVPPDRVIAEVDDDDPERPVRLSEARVRKHPTTGRFGWYWDAFDVSDPDDPTYRILDREHAVDMTQAFVGASMSGAAYPFRDGAGEPVLPWVVYHASRTGRLWDAFHWRELVEGTLQSGLHYSHLAHGMSQAGWPQRWGVNVELPSDQAGEGTGRNEVVADPATVILFTSASDTDGQPMIGQWGPGADIGAMSESSERYERRVAAHAGVSASDLLRVAGDPRSGFALAISREGKREASRKLEPVFAHADLELCSVVARLYAGESQQAIAPDGYTIAYQALPLSADERRAVLDEVFALLDRNLISDEQAQSRLRDAGLFPATK